MTRQFGILGNAKEPLRCLAVRGSIPERPANMSEVIALEIRRFLEL